MGFCTRGPWELDEDSPDPVYDALRRHGQITEGKKTMETLARKIARHVLEYLGGIEYVDVPGSAAAGADAEEVELHQKLIGQIEEVVERVLK